MPAEPDNVIHQLAVGDAAAIAEIVEQAHTSDDVTTLVAAALFAPRSDRPAADGPPRVATTTQRPPGRRDRRRPRRRRRRPRRRPRPRPPRRPPRQRPGRLDHRHTPTRHHHPKGPVMSTTTTTATASSAHPSTIAARPIVPTVVALAAHRPRLPARRLHRPSRRRTRRLGVRPPSSAESSPAPGSAPPNGRCCAAAASASRWIPATAVGLGAGLAAGAALVSYRTDITSLARHGCGLRARRRHRPRRHCSATPGACSAGAPPPPRCGPSAGPSPPPAASTSSQQCAVFGAYGCHHPRLPAEHHHRRVRPGASPPARRPQPRR